MDTRRAGHRTHTGRFGRMGLALLLGMLLSFGHFRPPPVAHAATYTVDSTADAPDATPGDGICRANTVPPRCTLRAAIEEANARTDADTISVPAGTYTLTLGTLTVTRAVSIEGAGAVSTFVQASTQPYGGTVDVMVVDTTDHVTVTGLTLRHGRFGLNVDSHPTSRSKR